VIAHGAQLAAIDRKGRGRIRVDAGDRAHVTQP
jgi:hypothetical protein